MTAINESLNQTDTDDDESKRLFQRRPITRREKEALREQLNADVADWLSRGNIITCAPECKDRRNGQEAGVREVYRFV